MGYMTWQVMFTNGVRIGIVKTKDPVFCGAVLGTTRQTACVWLTASTSIRRMPTASTGFVVC